MKPIVFILGVSGVGKTYAATAISEEYSLRHIDIDCRCGFARAEFPQEWDDAIDQVDFAVLAARVRSYLGDQHQGAVLSFPTTYRFTREQIGVAWTCRIGVILLWAELECCWEVRRQRQITNKGTTPCQKDYLRKNQPTYDMYKGAEYDKYRVTAMLADKSRPTREQLLTLVLDRLAEQEIQLTA